MEATFPAKIEALYSILNWIHDSLTLLNVPVKQQPNIELACEEALVNIIYYSYPITLGSISLTCRLKDHNLIITLKDEGVPYNPLHSIPTSPLPHMGGYGILIILHLMDQVDYHYINGCNELTLTKKVF